MGDYDQPPDDIKNTENFWPKSALGENAISEKTEHLLSVLYQQLTHYPGLTPSLHAVH